MKPELDVESLRRTIQGLTSSLARTNRHVSPAEPATLAAARATLEFLEHRKSVTRLVCVTVNLYEQLVIALLIAGDHSAALRHSREMQDWPAPHALTRGLALESLTHVATRDIQSACRAIQNVLNHIPQMDRSDRLTPAKGLWAASLANVALDIQSSAIDALPDSIVAFRAAAKSEGLKSVITFGLEQVISVLPLLGLAAPSSAPQFERALGALQLSGSSLRDPEPTLR